MNAVEPYQQFKGQLAQMTERGELILPRNVSEDAFINAALVAAQDNPAILTCERRSVFKSLRKLAAAGLVPDGREAALVPFKTKIDGQFVQACQAMPMVFGLIKTARNSGEITDIRAHIVYQREVDEGKFEYVVGDTETLRHEPILFGDRGDAVGVYAIATLKDRTTIREFMTAEQVDRVRRSSSTQRVFQKGQKPTISDEPLAVWKDWPDEMWKKSVIRRMCKRLPVSAEDMRHIMESEDDPIKEVNPAPEKRSLVDAIKGEGGDSGAPNDTDPQSPPEAEDAQVIPEDAEDDSHWTDHIGTDGADPMCDEYSEGKEAFADDRERAACPYDDDAEKAASWLLGYDDAQEAAQ